MNTKRVHLEDGMLVRGTFVRHKGVVTTNEFLVKAEGKGSGIRIGFLHLPRTYEGKRVNIRCLIQVVKED